MKYKIITNVEYVKASVKYLSLESRLFETSYNSNQKPFHFTYSTQFLEISFIFTKVRKKLGIRCSCSTTEMLLLCLLRFYTVEQLCYDVILGAQLN